MGMFDEVIGCCKRDGCEGMVCWQSKMGDCSLKTIPTSEVPVEIAKDIEGESAYCSECGLRHEIRFDPRSPETVPMRVLSSLEDD